MESRPSYSSDDAAADATSLASLIHDEAKAAFDRLRAAASQGDHFNPLALEAAFLVLNNLERLAEDVIRLQVGSHQDYLIAKASERRRQ